MHHHINKQAILILFAIFIATLLQSSPILAIPTLGESKAYIPRGVSNEIQLDLVIVGLQTGEFDGVQNPQDTIKSRLKIYFKSDSAKPIKYEGESDNDDTIEGYSIDINDDDIDEEEDDDDAYRLTAALKIIERSTADADNTIAKRIERQETIELELIYTYSDSSERTQDITVTVKSGVANEAPEGVEITPIHKGLAITWAEKEEIAHNDGNPASPEGVKVFIIDTSTITSRTGAEGLAAITYKQNKNDEAIDATCDFSADSNSCSIMCPENTYLDTNSNNAISGIEVISVNSSSNSTIQSGLTPNNPYAIFLYYEPSGIVRTECYIGTPKENFSLTELNDDSLVAKPGNPACFIATATYGSPSHKNLNKLRWFRDHYLLPTVLGKEFVRTYYKYSPPLAKVISNNEPLKKITRAALFLPVLIISCLQDAPQLTSTVLLLLTILIGITLVATFTRRHRLHM